MKQFDSRRFFSIDQIVWQLAKWHPIVLGLLTFWRQSFAYFTILVQVYSRSFNILFTYFNANIQFLVIDESCGETNGCTSGESWCEEDTDGNIALSILISLYILQVSGT
jgi:hypothetical protein